MAAVLRAATTADTDAVVTLAHDEETAWFGVSESSREEIAHPADPEPPFGPVFGWVQERGAQHLELQPTETGRVAWLEAHGWSHSRSVFDLTMRGATPVGSPAWPPGLDLRPYVRGEDNAAVHRLVYVDAEFAAVPGHPDRPLEMWQQMYTAENFSGVIAHRDGRPVGWVMGRSLLLHSFADLRAAGATDLGLTVQATNDRAIGLYRSVGLQVQKEWLVYARDPAGAR